MSDRSIVIHIGYHRTGTTFLQKDVSPHLSPECGVVLPWHTYKTIYGALIDGTLNNNMLQGLYSSFERSTVLFLSYELLSGDIMTDNLSVPATIHKVIPSAKIIITLRSQYTLLPSLYTYLYLKDGGRLNYVDFLTECLKNNKADYYQMVKTYIDLFGRANVNVLYFEELQDDIKNYCVKFSKIIDPGYAIPHELLTQWQSMNPRNRQPHWLFAKGWHMVNHVLPKTKGKYRNASRRFVLNIIQKISALSQKITGYSSLGLETHKIGKMLIKEHYRQSNAALFELLGNVENKFDYPS